MVNRTLPPTILTSANTLPTSAGGRRNVRRPPRRYVSKTLQQQYNLSVFQHIRKHMSLACISICYNLKIRPTAINLTKARQTIYRWARMMQREYSDNTLMDCLKEVTHATCFLGLPVCERHQFETKWYPIIRWPSERDDRSQGIVLRAWNKEGETQAIKLFEWYDRIMREVI